MKRFTWFNAVSTAVVLSGLLQACAVQSGSSTNDGRIAADVKKAIAQHSDLGPPNQINVDTHDGVVYLSGIVDNGLVTDTAITVARNVPGVKRVESTVSVDK